MQGTYLAIKVQSYLVYFSVELVLSALFLSQEAMEFLYLLAQLQSSQMKKHNSGGLMVFISLEVLF
jgi:hypothetical protein